MAIVTIRVCPRCSTPFEPYMDCCGFCKWPQDDPGSVCLRCNYVNPVKADRCDLCDSTMNTVQRVK